jgi:hypothetical protein
MRRLLSKLRSEGGILLLLSSGYGLSLVLGVKGYEYLQVGCLMFYFGMSGNSHKHLAPVILDSFVAVYDFLPMQSIVWLLRGS